MRKTSLILGICSIAMLTACKKDLKPTLETEELSSATGSENPIAQAASDPYVSNEILVKFKKDAPEKGRANALARIGGQVKEKVRTKMMERIGDEGLYVVHTPIAVLEAVGKMKGVEGIEYAEPNFIYTHGAASNDTYYTNGSLWGMYGDASSPSNQYGSQAAEAWGVNHTGSNAVYIGIIDEGFQNTHPDLDANEWDNPYDPVDGIDNDGNGYKDDADGWDFANNDGTIYDGGSSGKLDDHGTHVAGTIGAEGNGTGVVGVNWNVTLISGKFLGRNGGTTANAIKAVDYFTDLKKRHGLNIIATNNSWGGGGYSQALRDAIERANAVGILFIAAAGNGGSDGLGDNNETTPHYPSSYNNSNIISVASITNTGAKSGFSNYGATTVDLGAPGSGIYSCLAFNSYGSYSGTSMATPHVTGAAALYASTNNLQPKNAGDAAAIKKAILDAAIATPTSSLAGRTVTGGRLNVSGF